MEKSSGNQVYAYSGYCGTEVTINVSGEIDGKKYPSKAKFRIKSLPRPTPTVRGQIQQGGAIKLPRNALKVSSIGAKFENFDFDLKPVVKAFYHENTWSTFSSS